MNKRQRKKQGKKGMSKRANLLETSWNKGVHFRNQAIHFPQAVERADYELLYIVKEANKISKEGQEMKKNRGKKKGK